MKRALWAFVVAVPLVTVLAFGFRRDPNTVVSPLLQHPAPHFQLQDLDGKVLSSQSLRGKAVVLNVWASWCVACKQEHPYLLDAWQRYRSRGVVFVGVVYNDSRGSARAFMARQGGGWRSVLDPGGRTAIDFGVYGVPETFFIDRRGIVRDKMIGPVSPKTLNARITGLLKAA